VRLLITGSTGFVGRNLLLHARRTGAEIVAPVRDAAKLRAQCEAEDIPAGQIRILPADPARWGAVPLPTHAVLGAGVLFARSPGEYDRVNVAWAMEVLRALPGDCRVVVLSSQSAGGPTPRGKPARDESDPDRPVTWYGHSKLTFELAARKEFPSRKMAFLRPPMILGARDTATLPLFEMGRQLLRPKPALHTKTYSFIAVDDLVEAIEATLASDLDGSHYVASHQWITDRDLIAAAAQAVGGRGVTLPIPQPAVRLLSLVVDALPPLRQSLPSLTRDRAREIWHRRWVVDAARFSRLSGWRPRTTLLEAMRSARDFYVSEGKLPG